MTLRPARDRLASGEPSTWLVWFLGVGFVGLGLLFVAAPRAGAALFGLAAPEGQALGYVIAIGLRDLAFGLYILALSLVSSRRAVGTVLGLTVLIPAGDVILVAALRGLEAPGYLLLHAGSGAVMAGSSAWLLRSSKTSED